MLDGKKTACKLVSMVSAALINNARNHPDVCADPSATGFGRQRQPPVVSKSGKTVPEPLTDYRPAPKDFDAEAMMESEGATYNWCVCVFD